MDLLINPQTESRLLEELVGVLESAVERYPDNFEKVKDMPSIIDHYGYHNDVMTQVILYKQPETRLYWLRLPRYSHPVRDVLKAIILNHFA